MHENTWERVTFLVNLMFRRLDKLDGSLFREAYILRGGGGEGGLYLGC